MKRALFIGSTAVIIFLLLFYLIYENPKTLPAFANQVCDLPPNTLMSYQVSAKTKANISLMAFLTPQKTTSQSQEEYEQKLSGILTLRVIKIVDHDQMIEAQFSQVQFTNHGQEVAGMSKKLSDTFRFHMNVNCQLSNFAFKSTVDQKDQLKLKNILEEINFILPLREDIHHWQSLTRDSFGQFLADYTVTEANDSSVTINQKKNKYEKLNKTHGPMEMDVQIIDSQTKATFNAAGSWYQNFSSHQKVRLLTGGNILGEVEAHISITRLDKPVAWREDVTGEKSENNMVLFRNRPEKNRQSLQPKLYEPNYPAEKVQSKNIGEILKEFSTLLNGKTPSQRTRGLDLLVQYLRTNPDAAFSLTKAIKDGKLIDKHQSMAFLALSLAQTSPSQNALSTVLINQDHTEMNRMRSAIALSDTFFPEQIVVQSLTTQMQQMSLANSRDENDVSRTAALAVGILSHNMRKRDPQLSQDLEQELVSQLNKQDDPSEIALVIEAIGNTKNPELLNNITPYLSDTNRYIRSATTKALGAIGGPDSELLLVASLEAEDSNAIRSQIVKSLNRIVKPTTDTTNKIGDALLNESDAKVRSEMIRYLGTHSGQDLEIKQFLVTAFEQEQNTDNLLLIGKYLKAEDLQ